MLESGLSILAKRVGEVLLIINMIDFQNHHRDQPAARRKAGPTHFPKSASKTCLALSLVTSGRSLLPLQVWVQSSKPKPNFEQPSKPRLRASNERVNRCNKTQHKRLPFELESTAPMETGSWCTHIGALDSNGSRHDLAQCPRC